VGPSDLSKRPVTGLRGQMGPREETTGDEARQPYHKKEPAGFHDGEPSQVGMEGKHHGKTRSTPILRQNQTSVRPDTQIFSGKRAEWGPPKKPHESHRLAVARARFRPRGALDRRGGG